MAVHLTNPARVDMPVLGDYGAQIRRMFPKRLQNAVFEGVDGEDMGPELEARIREILKTVS